MKPEMVNVFPEGVAVRGERERWWNWPRFRLVPHLWTRPEDDHDRSRFHFSWLGLSAWSMMSPDLGASVELDDMGLEFRVRIPYLIIAFKLPLFPARWHQKTWRTKPWPRSRE